MERNEGKSMSFASRNSAQWRNNPFYKWHKSLKEERNKNINSFLTKENKSVDYDYSFKEKNELNPILWDKSGNMKPEVRHYLLSIAKAFYKYLDINIKIEDILIVGSNANYNYTDQSDIDLHLVMDLDNLKSDKKIVTDFMDVKKAYWGITHDIQIKNHDVECYVQDIDDDIKSGGIFSVKNNKWIKEPKKNKFEVNKNLVRKKVDYLATLIDDLDDLTNNEERQKESERIKNKIKKMRTSGLEKGGEFSEDNLAFKVLRNTGYLEKLRKIKNKAIDDSLTLKESFIKNNYMIEEKAVSEKQRSFFGIVRALQNGEIKPSKVSKKVKKAADEMSKKEVDDFASTKDSELKKESTNNNHKYEYGCLMNSFDIPTWEEKILSKIDKNDLYEGEGFGLETNPHVSVLFGFHPESTESQDIMEVVNEYVQKPIKIEIKKVSHFDNENYDVLKFDIESPELRELNNIMKERFEHTNNFPDYHPHMTIAYLKKGTADKYAKDFKPGAVILNSDEFVYSNTDGTNIVWNPLEKDVKKTIEFECNNGKNKLTLIKNDMEPTKIGFIKDFIEFVCDNLHMENPVHIFLRNGRDEYIRSTASYVPDENTNHINVKKRALVDILRSIAHELTHNRQREIEKFTNDTKVQNIGGEIENEADSVAGMLIKHYTHTCGLDEIYDL